MHCEHQGCKKFSDAEYLQFLLLIPQLHNSIHSEQEQAKLCGHSFTLTEEIPISTCRDLIPADAHPTISKEKNFCHFIPLVIWVSQKCLKEKNKILFNIQAISQYAVENQHGKRRSGMMCCSCWNETLSCVSRALTALYYIPKI